jgi:hypothetical protein
MVPTPLRRTGRAGLSGALRAAALLTVAFLASPACRGRPGVGEATGTPEERAAYAVRARYTSADVAPSAAWTWTGPTGTVFVIVDVESAIEGVVQAVADLWSVTDGTPRRIARSQVMPSVASMRALVFEDVTGDGLPDLLGAIADSAEAEYPIFLPGAQANLIDELEIAGAGYHFDIGEPNTPAVVPGRGGAGCALRLWATEPAPDSLPAGWRYLALRRGGTLDQPSAVAPDCGT